MNLTIDHRLHLPWYYHTLCFDDFPVYPHAGEQAHSLLDTHDTFEFTFWSLFISPPPFWTHFFSPILSISWSLFSFRRTLYVFLLLGFDSLMLHYNRCIYFPPFLDLTHTTHHHWAEQKSILRFSFFGLSNNWHGFQMSYTDANADHFFPSIMLFLLPNRKARLSNTRSNENDPLLFTLHRPTPVYK